MAIYFALIAIMSSQIAISEAIRREIAQGISTRNSRLGFKTSKTMASEEAWRRGHEAAGTYLRIDSICGIIGIVVSLVLLLVMGFSQMLLVVPLLVLVVQLVMIAAAYTAANNAAATA